MTNEKIESNHKFKLEEFIESLNKNYAHTSRTGDADHTEYNYAFYQAIIKYKLQDKYVE